MLLAFRGDFDISKLGSVVSLTSLNETQKCHEHFCPRDAT
jgi:hypothetical protein